MPETEGLVWVVIPAYNEAAAIGPVLSELSARLPHVAVVDDGSTDETAQIASRAGAAVIRHAVNLGQGAALRTGIDFALERHADYICTFDADGQHAAHDLEALLRPLFAGTSDVCLGSRFLGRTTGMPAARRLMLQLAVGFSRVHSGLSLSDTHNGLRAMTAAAARLISLEQPGMAHASEMLQKIQRHRLRYVEVPVTVRYTPYSRGKGQPLWGGAKILFDLIYEELTRR